MLVERWPVPQGAEQSGRGCSLVLVTEDGVLAGWVREQVEPMPWRWVRAVNWVAQVTPQDVVLGELDLLWGQLPDLVGVPVVAVVEASVDLGAVLGQGVAGCIIRSGVRQQLGLALQMVLAGQVYLSRELLQRWLPGWSARGERLSRREQEVLLWLTQGEANDQIAQRLGITVATVKAHLTSIFSKLQVQNRTQAIVQAMRWGG
ncbi:LuxR family transcriptional regulator [Gloeomargarita lithophora Alchichica-D10]|uniref:LuxR family transcriptional regulator n=1 Tax=Gloeomargarita lithophora Alchichica-D10 TaxID=1188229 RepID=A0A1J0AE40_9CYAN|nr:response regulator transcription factor [Gloeomargarita lithophora]APB34214.1 LuxR family transcriptional regulator [Gloeomargarita lithophora Alchichica-D10]